MQQADHPRSRQEFIDMLGELRQQAGVEPGDEAALVRVYDEVLQELEQEKARLQPEYERRCEHDGRETADRWLAETAEALGRDQGERLRRILQNIPALAPGQAG